MKALLLRLRQWAAWLDQRSLRERVLLLAAVLVVGFLALNALYFQPRAIERRQLREQIAALDATLSELARQAGAIKARAQDDPDRENHARSRQLQTELTRLDGQLKALTVDLISPQDMAEVLRELLTRQGGVELVRLENLPAVDLLPEAEQAAGKEAGTHISLYRHPVRIVIAGTYLQALDYLRDLEQLPRKLFWDELEITVGEYPRAEISLTVYTLSYRKGWIGV